MEMLLPITTVVLIAAGAFCLFMAIDHDRKARARTIAAAADARRPYSVARPVRTADARE
ncbi:hypothetical protein ACF3MZ_10190 [Paenibacillaceae bacterium WGS1546]|uniref:hypothetical protein n=1 Tax=Cohnella sp. WGS1546 TaxID=3366810 RepID=UPI00372D3D31